MPRAPELVAFLLGAAVLAMAFCIDSFMIHVTYSVHPLHTSNPLDP